MDNGLPSDPQHLRQQLEALLHEARLNEQKLRRFDQLERRLIAAPSLPALIHLLLTDYRQAFGIEEVHLALIDRQNEMAGILAATGEDGIAQGLALHTDPSLLEAQFCDVELPRLAAYDSACHAPLFPHAARPLASVALLPLRRQNQLIGSLHLGSADPERYTSDAGTAFLERLASIVAICLDGALAQERIKLAGLTDGLTGIQNRRYFDHRFPVEIAQARRHKHPLGVLLLDIDKFKRVNDTYGHPAGDAVLRTVASTIQGQLRTGDTVARYGGEEFVVLLPHTPGHFSREIAERIRQAVERHGAQLPNGSVLRVTLSVGLAMFSPTDEASADPAASVLTRADQSLYAAKHGGRNQVVCDGNCTPPRRLAGWSQQLDRLRHRLALPEWLQHPFQHLAR